MSAEEVCTFLALKTIFHKVMTDVLTPLMPKHKEQTKETKGEQTESNKGKLGKEIVNSCS